MTDSTSPRTSKRAAYAILVLLFLALAWNYRGVLLPGDIGRPAGEQPRHPLARPALLVAVPLGEFPREGGEAAALIRSWRESGARGVALTVGAWHTSAGAPRLEWFKGEMKDLRAALLLLRENGMEPVVWAGIQRARGGSDTSRLAAPPGEWLTALARMAEEGGAAAFVLPREVANGETGDAAALAESLHRVYSGSLGLNISDVAEAERAGRMPHVEFLAYESGPATAGDGRDDSMRCASLSLAAHRPLLIVPGRIRIVLHSALTMFTGSQEVSGAAHTAAQLARAHIVAGAPWLRGIAVDVSVFDAADTRARTRDLFTHIAGTTLRMPARGKELREAP